MTTLKQKYRQAALAYLGYGIVYLAGAMYLVQVGFAERGGPWWMWLAIGLSFILVIPPLLWQGYKWFARVIVVLVALRVVALVNILIANEGRMVPMPGAKEFPMTYGAALFLIVAVVTLAMLVRAAWDLGK